MHMYVWNIYACCFCITNAYRTVIPGRCMPQTSLLDTIVGPIITIYSHATPLAKKLLFRGVISMIKTDSFSFNLYLEKTDAVVVEILQCLAWSWGYP